MESGTAAVEVMETFEPPRIEEDPEQSAERPHFVISFHPIPIDVTGYRIGFTTIPAGIIVPIYSRNYKFFGHNPAVPDDEYAVGMFQVGRNFAGYAAHCIFEAYGRSHGLRVLGPLTSAEWDYKKQIVPFARFVLPNPFDTRPVSEGGFGTFGLFENRGKHLKAHRDQFAKKKGEQSTEVQVLDLMIQGNDALRREVKTWAQRRRTEASETKAGQLHGITGFNDFEYLLFQYAGVKPTSEMEYVGTAFSDIEREQITAAERKASGTDPALVALLERLVDKDDVKPDSDKAELAELVLQQADELATLKSQMAALLAAQTKKKDDK